METSKLILNGVFYLVLTSFLIFIWIKEKELARRIRNYRDRFSEALISGLKLKGGFSKKAVIKSVNFVETVGTAIILVLVIQKFYLGNFLVPTGSMIPTIMPKDRLFGNMIVYKFSKPKRGDIIVFKEPIQNKVLYTKRLMGLPGERIEIKAGGLYINEEKLTGVKFDREYTELGEIQGQEWIVPKKGDKLEIVPDRNYNDDFKMRNINISEVQDYLLKNPGAVSEILPKLDFYVNGEKTGMVLDFIHNKENIDKLIRGEKVESEIIEDYYFALGDNTNGSYDSRWWGFVSEDRIRGRAFFRFWPINRIEILK